MTDTSKEALTATIVSVLETTIGDWDLEVEGGITAETTLIEDLEFESIDVVQFFVAVEQALQRKGIPFEKLFIEEGAYVDDVSVREVVDFLDVELQAA